MSEFCCEVYFRRQNLELDIALEVPDGLTVLLGPNGAGKSTLLRLLAGLLPPDRGYVRCGNRLLFDSDQQVDLLPAKRRVGLMFQHLALFPHLNVRDNIAFGLRAQHETRSRCKQLVDDIVRKFGLSGFENDPVSSLSGGERQKVALARTLAVRPDLLLLDEPTATLDQESRWRFRTWLAEMLEEWRIPTLMVTHDPADAASFRKRIVVIENGRVSQEGSYHQLLHAPATQFVADFAGVNYISGEVADSNGSMSFRSRNGKRFLGLFEGCHPGPAYMTVLPWEVALYKSLPEGSPRNTMHGVVQDAVIIGDRVRITVSGQEKLVAEISHRGYLAMGEPGFGVKVYASFKAREARVENT